MPLADDVGGRMHSNKAEALAKLAESSRELDAEIIQLKGVAQHPRRNGWGNSLRAVVTLPFLGGGAVVVDALEVFIRRTSDRLWERDSPNDK